MVHDMRARRFGVQEHTRRGARALVGGVALVVALAAAASAALDAAQGVPSENRGTQQPTAAPPPAGEVTFYGNPNSAISSGVVIPAGRATLWTSGTTPSLLNADAPAGSRERYGDTETQAASILRTIETQLAGRGLAMKDVVYVRAYLVPDPEKNGTIDVAGWNAAYRAVFGTEANPTRTARSTVGVVALVNPDWLIEIEAFAVYPKEP
jgi:enamine deaminase RidA (YjgF/YER057c/UK114 family)